MTVEEYFALDEASETRLDLIDGEIVDPRAMAGGSFDHSTLSVDVGYAFRPALDARRCRPFSSDQKIRLSERGDFCYADFGAVCAEPEVEGIVLLNPTLVVEVLLPGTESYDRGAKFEKYVRLASIEEIVFVSPERPKVECFRRRGGVWVYEWAEGSEASIDVLGMPMSLAEAYRNVESRPTEPPEVA